MDYLIRPAVVSDAPAACDVVRCSITDLCSEDHQGDEATLAGGSLSGSVMMR